jgi:hypothetical protein
MQLVGSTLSHLATPRGERVATLGSAALHEWHSYPGTASPARPPAVHWTR